MKNLIKAVFKGNSVKVYKHVQKESKEKIVYIVDTYLDDMYMCIPNNEMKLSRVHTIDDLIRTIENDSLNEYQFTKEAYARCERQCAAIAL